MGRCLRKVFEDIKWTHVETKNGYAKHMEGMHVKFCYATKSCVAMIESFRGKHSAIWVNWLVEKEGSDRENCYYHDNEISVEKDVKKLRGVFVHLLCMLNET